MLTFALPSIPAHFLTILIEHLTKLHWNLARIHNHLDLGIHFGCVRRLGEVEFVAPMRSSQPMYSAFANLKALLI